MATPNLPVIKRLFAQSGNRCAFPGCNLPLVEESGTVTGEICHIHGVSPQGPRFNPLQRESERHGFNNLILLCSRHHIIVDSEPDQYSPALLRQFKREHEQREAGTISPSTESIAKSLLTNLTSVRLHNNSGQIAIASPGAIQANTLNFETAKQPKVTISPPKGSIGQNLTMSSYVDYLIQRYQDFQKADVEKIGTFKYIAIYSAIRREFGCKWQLIGQNVFHSLVAFLQHRIDRTKLGRIQNARRQNNYHSFEEHFT
jgi:hypothetical protein